MANLVTLEIPASARGLTARYLSVDAIYVDKFTSIMESGQFIIDVLYHTGSEQYIPSIKSVVSGVPVSVLPLIGVLPNSKSVIRSEYEYCTEDTCVISKYFFKAERWIEPLTYNQWIDWLVGDIVPTWEVPTRNRYLHLGLSHLDTPMVMGQEVEVLEYKTKLDLLMDYGLTRIEAIDAVARLVLTK